MLKLLNSYMLEYFCNCNTVTLQDTALCDIFHRHLKDGRRHGMDTYLFLLVVATMWGSGCPFACAHSSWDHMQQQQL
jgi:hypothetical protein